MVKRAIWEDQYPQRQKLWSTIALICGKKANQETAVHCGKDYSKWGQQKQYKSFNVEFDCIRTRRRLYLCILGQSSVVNDSLAQLWLRFFHSFQPE
jgi:hypothetical protein